MVSSSQGKLLYIVFRVKIIQYIVNPRPFTRFQPYFLKSMFSALHNSHLFNSQTFNSVCDLLTPIY